MPEDDDGENSIGTDMTSEDWGGDEEPMEDPVTANARFPSGRLMMVYTSGDDTVLRAALQADDHEKAVRYFEVWRTQGHTAFVIASAPSPR